MSQMDVVIDERSLEVVFFDALLKVGPVFTV